MSRSGKGIASRILFLAGNTLPKGVPSPGITSTWLCSLISENLRAEFSPMRKCHGAGNIWRCYSQNVLGQTTFGDAHPQNVMAQTTFGDAYPYNVMAQAAFGDAHPQNVLAQAAFGDAHPQDM